MDLHKDRALSRLKLDLLGEMREYMADGDVGYGKRHVRKCEKILDKHLAAVSSAKDASAALECVRVTVLKLNALNDKTDGELIETDQREQICELLIKAGSARGFNEPDEDVTEQWREW